MPYSPFVRLRTYFAVRRLVLTFALLLAGTTEALYAQDADKGRLANYRDWYVYALKDGDGLVCFAQTSAKTKKPDNVRHGDTYFMVALWKDGRKTGEPSALFGYQIRDDPAPTMQIGNRKWTMYAAGDRAYVSLEKDEVSLLSAMRKGRQMRIDTMSKRGTKTRYTFSLFGVTAALERISKACS